MKILQEMRDDQRKLIETLDRRFVQVDQRFEVIETVLRDLAQQLVILGRGVKVAIEERRAAVDKWDDHETRLQALERRVGGPT